MTDSYKMIQLSMAVPEDFQFGLGSIAEVGGVKFQCSGSGKDYNYRETFNMTRVKGQNDGIQSEV